jgi:GT2 family glycosyltransferase
VRELPSVAIVIPNWNGAHHLPECLDAVGELDYPAERLEVIVVDNGSTDESSNIVRQRSPTVRLVSLPRNEGFAAACNAGAREARSECIAFMNNDMRAERTWLRRLVDGYDPAAGYVCVAGVILNWDGTRLDFVEGTVNFHGFAWQEHFDKPVREELINDCGDLLFACGGSMLISQDVYLELGGFDATYFAYYEDVDLGWRLWLAGYKVRLAGGARIFHRHHGSAAAMPKHVRAFLYERNALLTLFKNLSDENLSRVLAPALLLLIHKAVSLTGSAHDAFTFGARELPRTLEVAPAGLLPLNAVFDVLEDLPQLLARRREVQRRRRRRDAEIFRLFARPFTPWMHDEGYLRVSILLRELFRLDRLFVRQRATRVLVVTDGNGDPDRPRHLIDNLSAAESVTVSTEHGGDALVELIAESDVVIAPAATHHGETIAARTRGLLVVDVEDHPPAGDSRLLARADVFLGSSSAATPIESLNTIVREPWRWRRGGNGVESVAVPEDLQRLLRMRRERKHEAAVTVPPWRIAWRHLPRGVRRPVGRALRRFRLLS